MRLVLLVPVSKNEITLPSPVLIYRSKLRENFHLKVELPRRPNCIGGTCDHCDGPIVHPVIASVRCSNK